MVEPTFCSGLADLASRYRGFIVDQWGVLHDGGVPYPDALGCLAELRASGKRVVLLSNSGKRASVNRRRLAALGIGADLYDALVTSGEATWHALAARSDLAFAGLGVGPREGRSRARRPLNIPRRSPCATSEPRAATRRAVGR